MFVSLFVSLFVVGSFQVRFELVSICLEIEGRGKAGASSNWQRGHGGWDSWQAGWHCPWQAQDGWQAQDSWRSYRPPQLPPPPPPAPPYNAGPL